MRCRLNLLISTRIQPHSQQLICEPLWQGTQRGSKSWLVRGQQLWRSLHQPLANRAGILDKNVTVLKECLLTCSNLMAFTAKEGHVIFIPALILGHLSITPVVSLQRLWDLLFLYSSTLIGLPGAYWPVLDTLSRCMCWVKQMDGWWVGITETDGLNSFGH